MAEERRTFKWGDQEYLLDDLLKLHASYENSYYDFARNDGKYDDNALMGLRKAITNRINAVKSGEAFDSDGSLSTDIADNTTIQTQKKGLLRKEKYVDQDNTAWAKHYLNKLVGKLNPYEKAKKADSKGWDMSKHGFGAYLTGQGLNAQEIFEKNDLRDEENPDSPRSFNQRHELLRKHLTGYRDWLSGKGFDFTKNDNEWDDTFLSDLNTLLSSEKFDNNNLAASLRKLGAGDSYTTAFTSDKYDLSETSADAKKAKAEKERKDQIKAYNDIVASHYGIYEGLAPRTAQMTAYLGQAGSNFFRTPEELLEWQRNTKGVDMNNYQQRYNTNKWDAEAAQYILPYLQANGRLQKTTIDGTEYVYDPASIDRKNYSFIAIDPVTGTMEQKFLYDIEHEGAKLRNKYLKPQGAARYQLEALPFKEGGVISMQTGGNFDVMSYMKQLDDQDYKQRAAAKGVEERELRESERTPFGEEAVLNNAEFTGNDIVQLATMATNIGSMFLDPLSGAAVGAGTSVVDFFNDINRDGFQGKDAWNLVKNLGMDALGVVPVIGDTFGTLGKVKKGLLQMAPKIIGYLGMAQGVMNSPQIIDSFTKILDERDMTVADWQNVASGINLIVSGTRMGKHALNTSKAKKAAKTDMLQVEVKDQAGNTKMLVLDGPDAEAVRKSDHSVEAVNNILKNIENAQGYTVSPKSGLFDFELKRPGRKVKNTDTGGEDRTWNPFERKGDKANVQVYYDPVEYARAYYSGNTWFGKKNAKHNKIGEALTTKAFNDKFHKDYIDDSLKGAENKDTFTQKKQTEVDNAITSLKEKAKANKMKIDQYSTEMKDAQILIDSHNKSIADYNEKYKKQTEEITNTNKTIESINKWRASDNEKLTKRAIEQARQKAKNAQKEIKKHEGKKSQKHQALLEQAQKDLEAANTLIESKEKELQNNSEEALNNVIKARATANKSRKDLKVATAKLQTMLDTLQKRQTRLGKRIETHSKAYNELLNYGKPEFTFNGEKVIITPTAKLDAETLKTEGLFKQGGSINRNKINKFLNYAKG